MYGQEGYLFPGKTTCTIALSGLPQSPRKRPHYLIITCFTCFTCRILIITSAYTAAISTTSSIVITSISSSSSRMQRRTIRWRCSSKEKETIGIKLPLCSLNEPATWCLSLGQNTNIPHRYDLTAIFAAAWQLYTASYKLTFSTLPLGLTCEVSLNDWQPIS